MLETGLSSWCCATWFLSVVQGFASGLVRLLPRICGALVGFCPKVSQRVPANFGGLKD